MDESPINFVRIRKEKKCFCCNKVLSECDDIKPIKKKRKNDAIVNGEAPPKKRKNDATINGAVPSKKNKKRKLNEAQADLQNIENIEPRCDEFHTPINPAKKKKIKRKLIEASPKNCESLPVDEQLCESVPVVEKLCELVPVVKLRKIIVPFIVVTPPMEENVCESLSAPVVVFSPLLVSEPPKNLCISPIKDCALPKENAVPLPVVPSHENISVSLPVAESPLHDENSCESLFAVENISE